MGNEDDVLQLVCLPCRLGQDSPLGNEDDVLATELLLKLTDQPGLNLLELLQLGHGHEDNDGLLASTAVNLLSSSDVQLPQLGLQVAVDLQVKQSLADLLLNLVRLLISGLDNLTAG